MPGSAFPASGSIEACPLASVLLALLREGRDGCLTVERGGITRRLYLRGGMIVYGSSTRRADRMGEILIAQGKLSRADLKRYWQESRSGNRQLGITLVLNGVIALPDLYQAVAAQVVTILDRLQKMRSGVFSFEEGRAPAPGTVLLRIPLALYLRSGGRRSERRVPAAPAPAAPSPAGEEALVIVDEEAGAGAAISFEEARRLEGVSEVSFLIQELRRRLGQGPHALLGVPADAARPAVQAAYVHITDVLGPGGVPPGCPPELIREAGEIFREVKEAFHAVTGGQQRQERAAAPLPPQRVLTKAEEDPSRRHFALGREWLARRNFWQAADALRQAVRLRPDDATYRQYLGIALMQTRRLPEAEEHLLEAARLEPSNPAHFVALGRIYRTGRLHRKAREAFQRALRLDPANRQARAELADLPEEQCPERRGESGLFRKIFGKG
jgi:tetratricopeptide (TPR) repeat protein